jgi:hypothetical protein
MTSIILVSCKGASGLASVRAGHGRQYRSRVAERKTFGMKRVLVFALEVAVGAVACAATILAISAWTGTGF